MKKILVLLLATAMLFASISCSNGNGSDSSSGTGNEVENGGGSGTGTGDKENQAGGSGSGTGDKENGAGGSGSGSDVPSTSDCTETATTLELSDGEWTVYMNSTADFMSDKTTLEATVTNGAYEFTSGESSMTVDVEKAFELMGDDMFEGTGMTAEEVIEMLKNMSDDEKNEMLESMGEGEGEGIPEGYKISWDDLTLNVEAPLSADDLADMNENLDLNSLPANAVIKTNTGKTKYTINFSLNDPDNGTLNVEIIAVKN